MQTAALPKGTRDFGPVEMQQRQYVINIITKQFQLFGFQPLETPAMELLSTLTDKYGDEGDQLMFKVLNNGEIYSQAQTSTDNKSLVKSISEKALRYDLTIPFARYVSMHRSEITLPFKRYQIQPVWRADRPQKGRYREFYQCDADIIGSNSWINEWELLQIYLRVFDALQLPINLHINNRKILQGIVEHLGLIEKFTAITVAIDKLDKIQAEGVITELSKHIENKDAVALMDVITNKKNNLELWQYLFEYSNNATLHQGLNELKDLISLNKNILFDISLARGLNYYTGTIVEVKAKEIQMGSLGGGGRYDNLTQIFGWEGVSGVGISFGLDRIMLALEEIAFWKNTQNHSLQVLFLNMNNNNATCLQLIEKLHKQDISAVLFPDTKKIQKQMEYANKYHIPWVAIIGETELEEKRVSIKNMLTGEQQSILQESIIEFIKK